MNRRQFINTMASGALGQGIMKEARSPYSMRGSMPAHGPQIVNSSGEVTLTAGKLKMTIVKAAFRYSFTLDGRPVAGPHPESGLVFGTEPVSETVFDGYRGDKSSFLVKTAQGVSAAVDVRLNEEHAHIQIRLRGSHPNTIIARTGSASPGYGLADLAVQCGRYTTDITGYRNDRFLSGKGFARLVSNFTFYPKQRFAVILIDPGVKIVYSTEDEVTQGVERAQKVEELHYFFGNPHQIYRNFLQVRNRSGHDVMLPKYEFFGVGWEAFGALGWNTNQQTVTESVDRYLSLGYPLEWMIVGSGFWPHSEPRFEATTSFGMFDPKLYPDPAALIQHFRQRGLKFMLGLRIAFITNGPFSSEGIEGGYFIKQGAKAKVFKLGFPRVPCYLLDAQNAAAVAWYTGLVKKWTAYGVEGFKEDLYGFGAYSLRDDKVDPVNAALMRQGLYVMGRNGYVGSPEGLHRINDFNYNQDQDRGPVNALALAYSGFPLVYPDIVGGTFGENLFGLAVTSRMKTYIMRNAQWASVHPSMGMGQPPWKFDDHEVGRVMLAAARLHERLHPYIFSQAVRFFHDGYPWTMTPLPLAFPDDEAVHGRENARIRGYEWMIGDSLLATPLYGNNFAVANAIDLYLPRGAWIDYDSGKRFDGPVILKSYPMPLGKTPLFAGGAGIVIEKQGSKLAGRLYPVARRASTVFWARDGKTESHLHLLDVNWSKPRVIDITRGTLAPGEWTRYAYEFVFEPGHNYEVH